MTDGKLVRTSKLLLKSQTYRHLQRILGVFQCRFYFSSRSLTFHRLENVIRDLLAAQNHDQIAKIVHQLCQDYAYAIHQPHARNGGLIGLAAAAIALGQVWVLIYDFTEMQVLMEL
jgi:hypothetical protein